MTSMTPEIVAAIVGAAAGSLFSWISTKNDLGNKNELLKAQVRDSNEIINQLNSELSSEKQQVQALSDFKSKYEDFRDKYKNVKRKLQKSRVVRTYSQPVIIVGPRAVGKTSLLNQWHAPWNHARLNSTFSHKVSTVPIYDFDRDNTEPHFADPDIRTDVRIHLQLKVHDFPGELTAQESVIEQARQETLELRQTTNKSLGIVLICMFDATDVVTGLSSSANEYYNGELFAKLRDLVAETSIKIDRLILIFNKFDLIKPDFARDDRTFLKKVLNVYKPIIQRLRGVCNSEKICEVITILEQDGIRANNRGGSIVLGECARKFVEVMAGQEAAKKVVTEDAYTMGEELF